MRADDRFDLRVGLLLDLDVLDDRLDHEVAVLQVRVVRRARQVAERRRLRVLGDLALRDAVGQELLDAAEALLQHVLVHFEDDRLEAGRRRHLRDARAHQPATQHANRLDRHH